MIMCQEYFSKQNDIKQHAKSDVQELSASLRPNVKVFLNVRNLTATVSILINKWRSSRSSQRKKISNERRKLFVALLLFRASIIINSDFIQISLIICRNQSVDDNQRVCVSLCYLTDLQRYLRPPRSRYKSFKMANQNDIPSTWGSR